MTQLGGSVAVSVGYLCAAILIEVAATSSLPRTEGFRHLGWTVAVLVGYAISFALVARAVQVIPVSIAYAVWSGAGTALVAVAATVVLKERPSTVALVGIGLVAIGVTLVAAGSHTEAG